MNDYDSTILKWHRLIKTHMNAEHIIIPHKIEMGDVYGGQNCIPESKYNTRQHWVL